MAKHRSEGSLRRLTFGAVGAAIIASYIAVAIQGWLRGSSGWSEFFPGHPRTVMIAPFAALYLVWQALPRRLGTRRVRK